MKLRLVEETHGNKLLRASRYVSSANFSRNGSQLFLSKASEAIFAGIESPSLLDCYENDDDRRELLFTVNREKGRCRFYSNTVGSGGKYHTNTISGVWFLGKKYREELALAPKIFFLVQREQFEKKDYFKFTLTSKEGVLSAKS